MLKEITPVITSPQGFMAAGVKAGIKKSGKEDVAIIYSTVPATVAGMFTTNQVAAAPVLVCREHIKKGIAQAIIINSGCANACTGEIGMQDAKQMARLTAEALELDASQVLVSSTGIIGVNLPMDKVASGIKQAVAELSVAGHQSAMQAIMTTDTLSKECAFEFTVGSKQAKIAGMAKGSGMIHPNMATMLAYITTDVAITSDLLQAALGQTVEVSFNMVTVDGDTSTNDSVVVLANGLAGNTVIEDYTSEDYKIFCTALKQVCICLAKKIAYDGEGATKFLEVNVQEAKTFAEAKTVGMSVAKSPLVKTAFFGQDPNWGRIICAVGYAGIEIDPANIELAIGKIQVVKNGMPVTSDEEALRAVMAEHDIVLDIKLGAGTAEATIWTCDFSYEYVKINGEYHT